MLEELVLERFLAGRVAEAVEEHLNYSFIVNFQSFQKEERNKRPFLRHENE